MKKTSFLGKIYVKKSDIRDSGRGVFAKVDIQKGEIVEECPIIEIPKDDLSPISESVLVNYIFFFGKKKERAGLILGFGSLYNHSEEPNVGFEVKHGEGVVEFVALEDIKKDRELTINYKGSDNLGNKSLPLWFEK